MKQRFAGLLLVLGLSVVTSVTFSIWDLSARNAAAALGPQSGGQRVVHPRETRLGKVYDPPPGTEKFQPHPRTQDAKVRVTLTDLKRWEKELSNWGRWGAGD